MTSSRTLRTLAATAILCFSASSQANAREEDDYNAPVPSRVEMQSWLNNYESYGWILFLDQPERQIVDFTRLQSMRCHIQAIRYSINSQSLDKRFPVAPCDAQLPTELLTDNKFNHLTLKRGSAETVTVQVIWDDGSGSAILFHKLCNNPGGMACAATKRLKQPIPLSQEPGSYAESR